MNRFGSGNRNSFENNSETSEQVSIPESSPEVEETSESFDDCKAVEQTDQMTMENSEQTSMENPEEDFDDCESEIESGEEQTSELSEHDELPEDNEEDFDDCAKTEETEETEPEKEPEKAPEAEPEVSEEPEEAEEAEDTEEPEEAPEAEPEISEEPEEVEETEETKETEKPDETPEVEESEVEAEAEVSEEPEEAEETEDTEEPEEAPEAELEVSEEPEEAVETDSEVSEESEEKPEVIEQKSLEDLSQEEVGELLEKYTIEQEKVSKEASEKFEAVMQEERGTEEYKKALQDYNETRERKEELDKTVDNLKDRQKELENCAPVLEGEGIQESTDKELSLQEQMMKYMSEHSYGPQDFETYSQDPEWRVLQRQLYPDYELPELTQENASAQLSQYMNDHNYGINDYDEYSQDPIWRELQQYAHPDFELPPISENITEVKEESTFQELLDKLDYTDKMRLDMEYSLGNSPERKEDWDIVRGRLSDEYKSEATELSMISERKQAEYNKLHQEYFELLNAPESNERSERLKEIADRQRVLNEEISSVKSRASYADTLADDLSRGLIPERRTEYIGVSDKKFTEIHSSLIQQQGDAVPDFKGTCGDCSCANTMELLGEPKTEAEVVERARNLKACIEQKIPSWLPESVKQKIRSENGGTSVQSRACILDSFGYDCENKTNQSLSDIMGQLKSGKGAIINVNHEVLNKGKDVSLLNPRGTDHALTITGVEFDSKGEPVGLWIHDTGVCSDMGNAFFCNKKDYETWRKTPNCTVQYVSRRKV